MIATPAYILAVGYESAHRDEKADGELLALAIFMAFDYYMLRLVVG